MSYRALLTVKKVSIKGAVEEKVFFKMRLDEDFKDGEVLAEAVSAARTYDEGVKVGYAADTTPCVPGNSNSDINRWAAKYADESWCVTFCENDGYSRVVISGRDGGGEEIFKRVTVYHVG